MQNDGPLILWCRISVIEFSADLNRINRVTREIRETLGAGGLGLQTVPTLFPRLVSTRLRKRAFWALSAVKSGRSASIRNTLLRDKGWISSDLDHQFPKV
jgi:hypothetical protein